jgi:hypothetical protein
VKVREVTDKYKKGVNTRRLYAFEANYFWGTEATRLMPMADLKTLAAKIWKKYGRGDMPVISAGPGTPHGNKLYSYSQGGYIQLARSQRNKLVLIHELIHELGYDEHDAGFVKLYLQMLVDVLKLNRKELLDAAKEYKLI